jgi:urea carboxylase
VEMDAPEEILNHKLGKGEFVIESSAAGSVWRVESQPEQNVTAGDTLIILESMKMEIEISAPESAKVLKILVEAGQQIQAGQALAILKTN